MGPGLNNKKISPKDYERPYRRSLLRSIPSITSLLSLIIPLARSFLHSHSSSPSSTAHCFTPIIPSFHSAILLSISFKRLGEMKRGAKWFLGFREVQSFHIAAHSPFHRSLCLSLPPPILTPILIAHRSSSLRSVYISGPYHSFILAPAMPFYQPASAQLKKGMAIRYEKGGGKYWRANSF